MCWLIFRLWAALLEGKRKEWKWNHFRNSQLSGKKNLLLKENTSIIGTTLGSAHPILRRKKVTRAVYTYRRVFQAGSKIPFSVSGLCVHMVTNEPRRAFEVLAPPVSARWNVVKVLICTFQTRGPCQNGWVLLATSCKHSHRYSVETCGWERHKQVL